ncbi:hypothetical protein LINPERPRIM_LOCUS650 [Linum perenne]
MGCCRSPIQ